MLVRGGGAVGDPLPLHKNSAFHFGLPILFVVQILGVIGRFWACFSTDGPEFVLHKKEFFCSAAALRVCLLYYAICLPLNVCYVKSMFFFSTWQFELWPNCFVALLLSLRECSSYEELQFIWFHRKLYNQYFSLHCLATTPTILIHVIKWLYLLYFYKYGSVVFWTKNRLLSCRICHTIVSRHVI